jgi:hypothetical protein
MSGGHWNYKNDSLVYELFGWGFSPNYGEKGFSQAKYARKSNPLEDKQLSEMLWDMFCILHSYDWYACGDNGEDTYRKDVAYFKKKWLKASSEELVRREIDASLEEARQEIYQSLGIKDSNCT